MTPASFPDSSRSRTSSSRWNGRALSGTIIPRPVSSKIMRLRRRLRRLEYPEEHVVVIAAEAQQLRGRRVRATAAVGRVHRVHVSGAGEPADSMASLAMRHLRLLLEPQTAERRVLVIPPRPRHRASRRGTESAYALGRIRMSPKWERGSRPERPFRSVFGNRTFRFWVRGS